VIELEHEGWAVDSLTRVGENVGCKTRCVSFVRDLDYYVVKLVLKVGLLYVVSDRNLNLIECREVSLGLRVIELDRNVDGTTRTIAAAVTTKKSLGKAREPATKRPERRARIVSKCCLDLDGKLTSTATDKLANGLFCRRDFFFTVDFDIDRR